ncbi:universal stress protein [Dactylosporangium sp. NBC_01737]|uniref:universal stress protein n=1 Tax=Dactylosporangium sp. NBC_01737 TaxID=2975959 RepID=UPI002E100923|nr:universal stress protein [Dactylosporangium sp. NBC_01737]
MGYRYGPVVVGVDGSADSVGALRWAADAACRHSRELHAVHVLHKAAPPGEASRALADDAAAEARRWLPGVCATGVAETGDAVEVLRRHSQTARLVVIGSHGTGGVDGKPVGAVAEALCLRAHCPVLVVEAGRRWADPWSVLPHDGPVLVGFDGSDPARRALRLGFEEAAGRRSRLIVIQVWQHPDLWRPGHHRHGADLAAEEAAIRAALHEAAGPWQARHPLVEMELRSEPGDPSDALSVASQCALLMVLGPVRTEDPGRTAESSVLRRVLRHMACPALIAHDPGRTPVPHTPPEHAPAYPPQEVRHGAPG